MIVHLKFPDCDGNYNANCVTLYNSNLHNFVYDCDTMNLRK